MKVLHVYAGNLFGGIETLLVTLARERHLNPDMEAQFAICFEGRLAIELVSTGVKVHQLGEVKLRDPVRVLRARARLEQVIRQNEIDLVICHACWPQVIFGGTVKQMGKPLVFWCHDTPTGQSLIEKLAKFVQPDLTIANSRYTQQHLHRLYPNIPDRVIYCPVSPIQVDRPHAVRAQIRARLGTPIDTTVIIQVSRMERWKGHSLTIAALGEIQDLDNWEYWIVGGIQRESERDYLADLQQQVAELGLIDSASERLLLGQTLRHRQRIRFLGERQDVPDLLTAADIFCQPNLNPEPFGIAFIEALSAGLPIVTVAMGGGGEIVNSACGYGVAPGNVSEIAQALRELVQNPAKRQQFRAAAIDRAKELCDPQQQIDAIDRVMNEVWDSKFASTH
jgi:glycosyltransferase involved in cell wall biosynthesis